MSRRRTARPGIARVEIEGVDDYSDRRIGNAFRYVVEMRRDHSAKITVDADTPEMAEALALDFWKSRRLGGRPSPTIVKSEALPPVIKEAWGIAELQDEIDRADAIAIDAKEARDELIREATELGPTEVAAITGLTKGRIPQIRKKS